MKRWVVDLTAGKVMLATNQHHPSKPEYCIEEDRIAFVLAVDELGAFVRAKQLIAKGEEP